MPTFAGAKEEVYQSLQYIKREHKITILEVIQILAELITYLASWKEDYWE